MKLKWVGGTFTQQARCGRYEIQIIYVFVFYFATEVHSVMLVVLQAVSSCPDVLFGGVLCMSCCY